MCPCRTIDVKSESGKAMTEREKFRCSAKIPVVSDFLDIYYPHTWNWIKMLGQMKEDQSERKVDACSKGSQTLAICWAPVTPSTQGVMGFLT